MFTEKRTGYTLAAVIALLAGLALAWAMLTGIAAEGANTPRKAAVSSGPLEMSREIDSAVSALVSAVRSGTEIPRKVYQLSDSDLVAPKPNAANYGQCDTAAEVLQIMEGYRELLGDEHWYFSDDLPFLADYPIRYYMDETIVAVTWKETHGFTVYTFSEVKLAHPSQFRRFLADGVYGSNKQYFTSEMSATVNAVVAHSADFYTYRPNGTVVYNGVVERFENQMLHCCMIDENGDMRFVYPGELADIQAAQDYVYENHIRFAMTFGPVLVENGELRNASHYVMGEVREPFARAALCQMGQCHYLVCSANMEPYYFTTPTMQEFADVMAETGCTMAYALDGGQTATLVMDNEVINTVSYGSQRKISDIIYFATGIPSEE